MKIILYFLLSIILLFPILSYSTNLNILGEINEYSSDYLETVSITLNCTERINFKVPVGAYDIHLNNESTSSNSFFLKGCSKANLVWYKIKALEKIDTKKYRVERNFNEFKNFNYTYRLSTPIEYELNNNRSSPIFFDVKYNNGRQELKFEQSKIFLFYFEDKNNDEGKNSIIIDLNEEITEGSVLILIFISFVLGSILTFFYMNNKLKDVPKEIFPSYILSQEEKNILEIIKENPGINQKQIGDKLNFSKSMVSSIICDFEQKQLIKREKFGRSFKVYLNKKIV